MSDVMTYSITNKLYPHIKNSHVFIHWTLNKVGQQSRVEAASLTAKLWADLFLRALPGFRI